MMHRICVILITYFDWLIYIIQSYFAPGPSRGQFDPFSHLLREEKKKSGDTITFLFNYFFAIIYLIFNKKQNQQ